MKIIYIFVAYKLNHDSYKKEGYVRIQEKSTRLFTEIKER